MMYRPGRGLSRQSWLRTKTATSFADFKAIGRPLQGQLLQQTPCSPTIKWRPSPYLHPQFIPKRNDRFDYTPAPWTARNPPPPGKGDTPFAQETPHLVNPAERLRLQLQRSALERQPAPGSLSKARAFPRNTWIRRAGTPAVRPRAASPLEGRHDFTLEGLRTGRRTTPTMPEFANADPAAGRRLRPSVSFERTPYKAKLAEPHRSFCARWDFRWGADSDRHLPRRLLRRRSSSPRPRPIARQAAGVQRLCGGWRRARPRRDSRVIAFGAAVWTSSPTDFGRWNTPWGEINRYQRLDDAIAPHFDDAKPSIPVPFTSAQWGSLASFGLAS